MGAKHPSQMEAGWGGACERDSGLTLRLGVFRRGAAPEMEGGKEALGKAESRPTAWRWRVRRLESKGERPSRERRLVER